MTSEIPGGATPAQRRLAAIVALVRNRGYVSNEDLARQCEVTVQTIRRDVNHLADQGLLARHHGGAGLPSSVENIAYTERQILNRREKEAIGRRAARLIPDNASLFINIGTTTEAFAQALGGHQALQVITNNLHVAAMLAPRSDFKVVVAGGRVRSHDGGIVGPAAAEALGNYRVDIGVIGISGIEDDGSLMDFDVEEIECARAIMRNARRVVLLADHTKFTRHPLGRVGPVTAVHDFVTDRVPPARLREILERAGTRLHIAEL
ncbi:glycerol-3-phosphate regulon repressor [Ameyamaea chiangmaiensis NBRC 103196]|uniref:DeoR/GlpR transcriptional regulator n=1 Tax=Ameyamaea chiangmaiensis TaxID=442969 RepID=A0A850P332_9PROT|nr:DeoR/GlpR family DNA-binding transcription regulator [Ameyamaea chiangmaiensis]MBS4073655.1 DeoR/GlpR transcriptional regulator [Ameyamaea chiangmaiensis]NVN39077.1 DeoR/GlpR transcriptional regulator [Ameyamaea chiangmaiensis]GBQ68920.1 glycerol-3-phosphate regulon repressor [Ameyamaea chiangmaiensis NBRC 103196]